MRIINMTSINLDILGSTGKKETLPAKQEIDVIETSTGNVNVHSEIGSLIIMTNFDERKIYEYGKLKAEEDKIYGSIETKKIVIYEETE